MHHVLFDDSTMNDFESLPMKVVMLVAVELEIVKLVISCCHKRLLIDADQQSSEVLCRAM